MSKPLRFSAWYPSSFELIFVSGFTSSRSRLATSMAVQNAAMGSSPFLSKCARSENAPKAFGSLRKLFFAKRS
eukprot:9488567-Pyramimonas_sp.AAC.1